MLFDTPLIIMQKLGGIPLLQGIFCYAVFGKTVVVIFYMNLWYHLRIQNLHKGTLNSPKYENLGEYGVFIIVLFTQMK